MSTAIVTGATGITGSAIVRTLLKNPSITKIYTFSRSQASETDARIEHVYLDLQSSAEDMTKSMTGVSADYVFFCAYLARPGEEAALVNGKLLSNFIEALERVGAVKKLRRFLLTCGFKHYGVHQGLPKQPLQESDPRLQGKMVDGKNWPSNFYYTQQETLQAAAARGGWEWICTFPNDVIGYAEHNFMNEATALGLYCAVSKSLPGSKLIYPGNKPNYFAFNSWTSADLHAQFCLWAARAPGAGNNLFNVTNGDVESFQNLWPRLAERFGCSVPENMFDPATAPPCSNASTKAELPTINPIALHAKILGVVNEPEVSRVPTLQLPVDPQKWAKNPEVAETWNMLRDRYNLNQGAWEKATWDFLTFVLGREWGCVANMTKARKLGWTGYEDTWESFERTFEALEREGIMPPLEQLKKDFQ